MPMPPVQNSCPLKLEVELPQSAEWRELEIYLRQYATELCADLALPLEVSLSLKSLDRTIFDEPGLFRISVDGRVRRSPWWPQTTLPDHPSVQEFAGLVCLALYDCREFFVTSGLARAIATEWKITDSTGYGNHWSAGGFLHFLRAFPKYNFSLRHARRFIESGRTGAGSESDATCLFEQAMEDATDIVYGPAVAICQEEHSGCKAEYDKGLESLRNDLDGDLGIVCPEIRIEQSCLIPGEFQIQLNDVHLPIIRGLSPRKMLLFANPSELSKLDIETIQLFDPLAGYSSPYADDLPETRTKVAFWRGPADYVRNSLRLAILGNAGSLLMSPVVRLLLEHLKKSASNVRGSEESIANLIRSAQAKFGDSQPFHRRLTAILRRLLDEQVPIRDLVGILESFCSLREVRKNGAAVGVYHFSELGDSPIPVADGKSVNDLNAGDFVFAARLGAKSLSVRNQGDVRQILPVLALARGLETALAAQNSDGVVSRELGKRIFDLLNTQAPQNPAIVVSQSLRAKIRERLRLEFPTVPVFGSSEISKSVLAGGYFALGDSLRVMGAFRKAIDAHRQAIDWAPGKAGYHANLAYALALQGEYLTAKAEKCECYSKAVEEYRLAIDINPEMVWCHHYLSVPLKRLHRWDEAAKELREAIRLDEKDLAARRELAECLSGQGKFDEAVRGLEDSRAAYPSVLEFQIDLARGYAQNGEYDKAVSLAEQISTVENPPQPAAELLSALRNAQETARKITNDPQNADLFAALGHIHVQLGNLQAAAGQYLQAAKLDQSRPDFHKWLGNMLFKQEDWGGAASEWEKVLRLTPDDTLTLNNLGTAYDALEQTEKAMTCYERAAKPVAANFVPQYNLGSSNYRLGRMEEARDAYQKAVGLNDKFAPSHFNLGNCYYRLEHPEQAIAEWEKAIELDPKLVEALYNLGLALWVSGDATGEHRKKAIECWKEALRLDPNLTVADDNRDAVAKGDEPDRLAIFDLLRTR
jgi:tetratricopeptide (TPR) repeat protein